MPSKAIVPELPALNTPKACAACADVAHVHVYTKVYVPKLVRLDPGIVTLVSVLLTSSIEQAGAVADVPSVHATVPPTRSVTVPEGMLLDVVRVTW